MNIETSPSRELAQTRVRAPDVSRRLAMLRGEDPCPVGMIVGAKYVVTSRIGSGGMGIVVAAKHLALGHSVAIKTMHPNNVDDASALRRFLREARAAASLKSDHAVRIYDVGRSPAGIPYLVMEHLDGIDLAAYVKQRRQLPTEEAVDLIVQACTGVAEAHAAGLIHRDLKPQNLFLEMRPCGRTRLKVLDFGLVKLLSDRTSDVTVASTPEGTILGSPHFMSPEQIRAPADVDVRTDVWSLGATLFQLLTGESPFHAVTIHVLLARILVDTAPDVRTLRADVPDGIARVISRCLARDPNDRFPTADALAQALLRG